MKLDRNINPDKRGKYALINLRKNIVEWGGQDHEQFFVMKYKDMFTAPALKAYADAITKEVKRMKRVIEKRGEENCAGYAMSIPRLEEFATEIYAEAKKAKAVGQSFPT